MPRDLLGRPPLRASELPPGQVRLFPGEPRAVVCPACGRWQVPRDGGLRRHFVGIDAGQECGGSGLRVWFDLVPGEWLARLRAASREAAARRGGRVVRSGRPSPRPAASRLWAAPS
jgi:hypothetical protein